MRSIFSTFEESLQAPFIVKIISYITVWCFISARSKKNIFIYSLLHKLNKDFEDIVSRGKGVCFLCQRWCVTTPAFPFLLLFRLQSIFCSWKGTAGLESILSNFRCCLELLCFCIFYEKEPRVIKLQQFHTVLLIIIYCNKIKELFLQKKTIRNINFKNICEFKNWALMELFQLYGSLKYTWDLICLHFYS